MSRLEDYSTFKEGDLVKAHDLYDSSIGIVSRVDMYRDKIEIFWPESNKLTRHGRKWAELHMEILSLFYAKK